MPPVVWRHTLKGAARYVTVVIDLTPLRDGTGPARLLDMVPARSKQVLKGWLAARPRLGGRTLRWSPWTASPGARTAASQELADARAVPDPFHVVRLAGDALDGCRRRIQQQLHGRPGARW
ncbi:transposase [Actinomyces trachealis]|uniref:transposase n=1 Tax=Actinomyces trachealis TaxID=2763540 RepID=UPI0024680306|nr:transposase [Actinomyces trachealis]